MGDRVVRRLSYSALRKLSFRVCWPNRESFRFSRKYSLFVDIATSVAMSTNKKDKFHSAEGEKAVSERP